MFLDADLILSQFDNFRCGGDKKSRKPLEMSLQYTAVYIWCNSKAVNVEHKSTTNVALFAQMGAYLPRCSSAWVVKLS